MKNDIVIDMLADLWTNDITIEAMSFKKMLKSLSSKFKEGEIVNVVYKNKKDNLINKDVKVGSND